jgi:hypothetical protein
MSDTPMDRAEDEATAQLRWVLERARQGDEAALPRLREILDTRPELWRHFGDLASHARGCWIDLIAGRDLALKESIARKVDELGRELSGTRPSAMEKLLVERVLANWLQLEHAEVAAAQSKTTSVPVASFVSKRLDRAHHRFLTSLGALATLRRLMPAADDVDPNAHAVAGPSPTAEDWSGRPRLRIAGATRPPS